MSTHVPVKLLPLEKCTGSKRVGYDVSHESNVEFKKMKIALHVTAKVSERAIFLRFSGTPEQRLDQASASPPLAFYCTSSIPFFPYVVLRRRKKRMCLL